MDPARATSFAWRLDDPAAPSATDGAFILRSAHGRRIDRDT
jgi:hypothetical protein